MADPEVIELDAPSDALHGLQSRRKSHMCEAWNFEVAPVKRDKTHNGAQCLPCKHEAELKGIEVKDEGTCLADLPSILAHVKGCTLHTHTHTTASSSSSCTLACSPSQSSLPMS